MRRLGLSRGDSVVLLLSGGWEALVCFTGSPAETAKRVATLLWRYRGRLLQGIGPQTWTTPLPLHSIAGFRVALNALLGGHRMVLAERFHPAAAVRLRQTEEATGMAEELLTFDEFRAGLSRAFNVPVESLRDDTNFLEDLAFDSLRMLQLGMVLEGLDVEMPAEMAWEIQTAGEAHAYCTTVAQTDGSPGERPDETVA